MVLIVFAPFVNVHNMLALNLRHQRFFCLFEQNAAVIVSIVWVARSVELYVGRSMVDSPGSLRT